MTPRVTPHVRAAAICSCLLATTLGAVTACSRGDADLSPDTSDDGRSALPPIDGSPGPDVEVAPDAAPDGDAAPRACSDDGFCHTVVPNGERLRGVWGDGLGTVWAISLEGSILRWDGSSWTVHHHEEHPLLAIWGSGPTDIWVVTEAALLHGQGASPAALAFASVPDLPGDASLPLKAVWGTGPGDIWAVGGKDASYADHSGRVLHYGVDADGGTGWTLDEELSSKKLDFRGVFGSPSTGVWIHGVGNLDLDNKRAHVFRRLPGANAWSTVSLPDAPGIHEVYRPWAAELFAGGMASDTSLSFRGRTGGYHDALWVGTSADDGGTFDWTYRQIFLTERVQNAFWGLAPTDTWSVGKTGLVTHWDGKEWKQALLRVSDDFVGNDFWAIWGTSNDDVWVVGDGIALHKTKTGKP